MVTKKERQTNFLSSALASAILSDKHFVYFVLSIADLPNVVQ